MKLTVERFPHPAPSPRRARIGRHGRLAVASATALALALSGCASESEPGDVDPDTTLTLKVGVGSAAVDYGPFWIAEAEGLFAENGLEVQTTYNSGAGSANLLASEQIDILLFTMPLGLQLAAQGKPTTIIYELARFDATSFAIASTKDIDDVSQLKALGSGCRIANNGQGTGTFAYQSSFLKNNGLDCESVSLADTPSVVSAVAAGSVNAAIVPYNVGLAAEAQGQLNLLVNPAELTDAEAAKVVPDPYPAYAAYGLSSVIQKEPEAVARFIKALNQGLELLNSSSPEELADMMLKIETFTGTDKDALVASWSTSKGRFPTGDEAGYLSQPAYESSLAGFELWGLPEYDSTDPELSYAKRVDMSYWEAATKG